MCHIFSDDIGKPSLRVADQCHEERIGVLDLIELALLRRRPLLRTAEQAIGHLASRQRRGRG